MSVKKTALITGITSQDGAYLANRLLRKNYKVIGLIREQSKNSWRLEALRLTKHPGLTLMAHDYQCIDPERIAELIDQISPDEIYNLAAISSIAEANSQPFLTSIINGQRPLALLEAIRILDRPLRFFQASSAEMFGKNRAFPQDESTPLAPEGAYAITKSFAHQMVEHYRTNHNIFASSGVLYNHESPLRGTNFVTMKIISSLVALANGQHKVLEIGNLDAVRDWGAVEDYVDAMHKSLNCSSPGTYLIATGNLSSVRQFVTLSAEILGIDLAWKGNGQNETGVARKSGRELVRVNPVYYRAEPFKMAACSPDKAKTELGWNAISNLETICRQMVNYCQTRSISFDD